MLFSLARDFNLMALGEETASELGVEVERVKKIAFVFASLITGAVVSVSGLIGFVGLVVPHLVRMIWGPDHRFLLPASAVDGRNTPGGWRIPWPGQSWRLRRFRWGS